VREEDVVEQLEKSEEGRRWSPWRRNSLGPRVRNEGLGGKGGPTSEHPKDHQSSQCFSLYGWHQLLPKRKLPWRSSSK